MSYIWSIFYVSYIWSIFYVPAPNAIMMSYIWSILQVPQTQVCMIYISSEQSATQQ